MHFALFCQDIRQNNWNVFGAEVYVDGRLAHSFGDTQENRHPIYSATKTITSIALGMAADEGKLDIAKPLTDYLPKSIVAEMSCAQREAYRHISLRRLMCMSVAGFPFRPQGESWLRDSLSYPLPHPGLPAFDYSNISAYLAGVMITEAMGQDAGELIARRILTPLGITDYRMGRCPEGYFYGASAMELSVESLSRLG